MGWQISIKSIIINIYQGRLLMLAANKEIITSAWEKNITQ